MRKLLLLFGASILSLASFSQATISNQSFEDWENITVKDSLDYWATSTQQYQQMGVIDLNNSFPVMLVIP